MDITSSGQKSLKPVGIFLGMFMTDATFLRK
jgi:hypothetical protein